VQWHLPCLDLVGDVTAHNIDIREKDAATAND
jgi:hypothetical protein